MMLTKYLSFYLHGTKEHFWKLMFMRLWHYRENQLGEKRAAMRNVFFCFSQYGTDFFLPIGE